MTDHSLLFEPIRMGDLTLPNRVLMAPLTRNRSQGDGTPKEWAETYYRQRASAGLIFSEATQISDMGKGYLDTPGIYTEAHVDGWKKVVDAVHAGGGRIFCQLWHVGRISHVSLLPEGKQPVSASAIQAAPPLGSLGACGQPSVCSRDWTAARADLPKLWPVVPASSEARAAGL